MSMRRLITPEPVNFGVDMGQQVQKLSKSDGTVASSKVEAVLPSPAPPPVRTEKLATSVRKAPRKARPLEHQVPQPKVHASVPATPQAAKSGDRWHGRSRANLPKTTSFRFEAHIRQAIEHAAAAKSQTQTSYLAGLVIEDYARLAGGGVVPRLNVQ
jgi:hypothetical protein